MLETSLCRIVSIVTWEGKESDQEYFKYWPFPTSCVLAALAPTASSLPVPQHEPALRETEHAVAN